MRNSKAAFSEMQQSEKQAFEKINKVLSSDAGYNGDKPPSKDFLAYIDKMKQLG